MTDEDFIRHVIHTTKAFLRVDEGLALADMASQKRDGYVVEIGALLGGSTIILATASKDSTNKNKIVVTVDPFTVVDDDGNEDYGLVLEDEFWFEIFSNNLKSYDVDNVVPIASVSNVVYKIWNLPIRLLFVDGNHNYAFIRDDLRWTKFIVSGGYIVLHDYGHPKYPGVVKAVDEFKNVNKSFKFTRMGKNMIIGKKE